MVKDICKHIIRPNFRHTALSALLTALALTANAQTGDNMKWKIYQSFNDITEIEPTGKEVFVLASNGIYSYNPADATITTYDKTNSLSDISIRHIAWNKAEKKLVIAYDNANIDLLTRDGQTTNVPDIYLKQATFDKTINDIYIYDNFAYISTGFGIVKLNVRDGSITDSYQLGFAVDYCYIENGSIYAASRSEGLYSCTTDKNLIDRNNWSRTGEYTAKTTDRKNVYDESGGYWWTTTEDGRLTYYSTDENGNKTYMTQGVSPEGPASNNFYRIYFNDGKLYGVSGIWSQIIDGNRKGEIHVFDGDSWAEFETPRNNKINSFVDVLCLDFDPADPGHVMVGTKSGLYEFKDNAFVRNYDMDNSLLRSGINDYNYTIVTSVKFDDAGNLWVLNPMVDDAIKRLSTASGEWQSFTHNEITSESNYELSNAFISPTNGRMWFTNSFYQQTRLFAYDTATDEINSYGPVYTNQNGTPVEPHYVYAATEDREGNVWIGTDVGPLYLSAESIRTGSATFTQYTVPRNDGTNYGDYLLDGIDIRAIAIDGGNRKWIGTNDNGVFLISDDNNTQIQHFTTDNSPLMSDIVQSIAIDGTTGEVFFATDKGLCSYAGDATEPVAEMTKDNVYAYPNPVRPDYTGLITIVGLTYDADIKIVTSNGALVNEGRSTGGTYTWDGCDLDGKRVASGVYMVMTATSAGEKGTVCKIAVVN